MKLTGNNFTEGSQFSVSALKFWLKFRLVPFFAAGFVKILAFTMRFEYNSSGPVEDLVQNGERIILAFYHRRLIMMPWAYPFERFTHLGERRGVAILSSSSKDGEMSAATWRWFGIHAVRGTASQNGAKALIKLIGAVKDGWDIGVTVDGPRGPRGHVKGGVLTVSKKTSAWIVPVCVAYSKAWKLRSWDEMLIPKPFSLSTVQYGVPFRVPNDCDLELFRYGLEVELEKMESLAEKMGY
jgi:hypothetical protein